MSGSPALRVNQGGELGPMAEQVESNCHQPVRKVCSRRGLLRGARLAQSGLCLGPGNADHADDQAQALLLVGEDLLDRGPDLPSGIAAPDMGRHQLAARLRALQVRHHRPPGKCRQVGGGAIGDVGPHPGGGVAGIQEALELSAVMGCGVRHRPGADQAMGAVDADVALVAEQRRPPKTPPSRPSTPRILTHYEPICSPSSRPTASLNTSRRCDGEHPSRLSATLGRPTPPTLRSTAPPHPGTTHLAVSAAACLLRLPSVRQFLHQHRLTSNPITVWR